MAQTVRVARNPRAFRIVSFARPRGSSPRFFGRIVPGTRAAPRGRIMERTNSEGQGARASSPRDLILAACFSAIGLAAIVIGRGGLGVMIAGSIGSVGASVAAVGLASADVRLSFS